MIEAGRSGSHSADGRVSGDISMWTFIVHCAMCLAGPHARLTVSHTTGNGSSHVPAPSTQAAKHAAATAAVAGSGKVTASPAASRNQRAPHYSLAEPKASLLSSLSLSPYSTTDLMLDIRLPPTTIKMARGHFPNHTTQPANHRMGIVSRRRTVL